MTAIRLPGPPPRRQRRPTSGLLRDYMAAAALDTRRSGVLYSRPCGTEEVPHAGTKGIDDG